MIFFQNSQTNWKYLLIIIILAVLVGGGILAYQYWWLPKMEVRPPDFLITRDETAGWQTYRNEEYGFELKIPNNWYIGKGTGILPIIRISSWSQRPNENSNPYRDIEIIVLPGLRNSEKLEQFVQQRLASPELVKIEYIQNLTIGDEKALEYTISPSNSEDGYRSIFVSRGNHVYEFDIYENNPDMKIFNQILSTFKFTK